MPVGCAYVILAKYATPGWIGRIGSPSLRVEAQQTPDSRSTFADRGLSQRDRLLRGFNWYTWPSGGLECPD